MSGRIPYLQPLPRRRRPRGLLAWLTRRRLNLLDAAGVVLLVWWSPAWYWSAAVLLAWSMASSVLEWAAGWDY